MYCADDPGCVPVCLPPAVRAPVEETVETKKVEMREELPTKGTIDLNVLQQNMQKLMCPALSTKIFGCCVLSCFVLSVFLFLDSSISHIHLLSTAVFYFFYCTSAALLCFTSQRLSISLVMLTQLVSFKFP